MKNVKLITIKLLLIFSIITGGVFLTSSTNVEKSNTEMISKLSLKLSEVSKELNTLKSIEKNTTVSMDPFIGEVVLFAGNFAPRGWAFCEGQVLQISDNTALFSILGTSYGGDGRTTYALPNLENIKPKGQNIGSKVELHYIIALRGVFPSRS